MQKTSEKTRGRRMQRKKTRDIKKTNKQKTKTEIDKERS
jgi:hypothetical protein